MPFQLLLISKNDEDVRFADAVAQINGFDFTRVLTAEKLRSFIIDHPQTIVLWGADDADSASRIGYTLLQERYAPGKVFAITDDALNQYPHLFQYPAFGHHVFRRFQDPATPIYAKIMGAVLQAHPFGLQRYFPQGARHQQINLTRSVHKRAAVEALQNFFTKLNLNSRLAAFVAQVTDELLMNAIFDAPVNASGAAYRRGTPRDADFELSEKEQVLLEVTSTPEYVGICVADQFGSLKKDVVLGFLRKDYQDQAYTVRRNDPGAGLGLNGTIQAGMSLLFICKPKLRTEVMMFFPNGGNYKSFREGFRFVSLITD